MELDSAYELVAQALDAGRPANAYLIVGPIRGAAGILARRLIGRLFPGHDEDRPHPDVHRLAPESKSRIISVEAMNERLVDPMAQTAFSGGWKVGVVERADRLNPQSANAFLKTLEEPPPKTLFLLLTDAPEQLLPTIVSRCQRIDLPMGRGRGLGEPWRDQVVAALAMKDLSAATYRAAAAGRLVAVLEALREKAEEIVGRELEKRSAADEELDKKAIEALVSAHYREFRADFCQTVMAWFRDLMALAVGGDDAPLLNEEFRSLLQEPARKIPRARVFRNLELVEGMAKSFDRNMNEAAVVAFLTDMLAFGAESAP